MTTILAPWPSLGEVEDRVAGLSSIVIHISSRCSSIAKHTDKAHGCVHGSPEDKKELVTLMAPARPSCYGLDMLEHLYETVDAVSEPEALPNP